MPKHDGNEERISYDIPRSQEQSGFKVTAKDAESRISHELFLEYRSHRAPWFKDRVENDNFYHNLQYTGREKKEIMARGQAPLSINITYAIVKQMIALVTSSKPVWNVDPVGDVDKEYAYLHRRLLDAVWYNSKGDRVLRHASKYLSIVGVGYLGIQPNFRDAFGVSLRSIPYSQVYVSPDTLEQDYSDADNILISRVVSVKKAAEFFGKTEDEIKEYKASIKYVDADENRGGGSYTRYTAPIKAERGVRIIQRLTMEEKEIYQIQPLQENIPVLTKVYFEVDERLRGLERRGLIRIKKMKRRVLAKYLTIGDYTEKYYLPIDSYNIVPIVNEFNDSPYPMGDVDFLYGLQRALNKFVLLSILNATLSNNMAVMAPRGTIDTDYWARNVSIPGAILEYDWEKDQPKPERLDPVPLSGAFFEFPQVLIQIMEYITGIFGVVQGDPRSAPGTASGLMSLQSYGSQKVKLLLSNVEYSLAKMGDTTIQLFQNYAPFNQVLQYFEGSETQSVSFNELVAEKNAIRVKNDLSIGKFRTRVKIIPNMGSERAMRGKVLSDLAAQTGSQMLIGPILKLLDIPEADEIAEQINALQQAETTIEQLQGNLERMEQVNRQLENQVLQRSQKVEVTKFASELDKIKNKIEKEYGIQAARELANLKNMVQSADGTE